MKRRIRILAGKVTAEAELNESGTGQLIWEGLPIEAKANLWGEEIYFSIPLRTGLEAGSPRGPLAGRTGILADGKRLLYLLRAHPGKPGKRDPRRQRG